MVKKQFKDTEMAKNIRNFIYSFRRWKRYNRKELRFWKKLNFWILACIGSVFVGLMLSMTVYRWFMYGGY